MTTEKIKVVVEYSIQYETPKGRKEGIKRIIKEAPYSVLSAGGDETFIIEQTGNNRLFKK